MNREFGLSDPLSTRFAKYVMQLAQGDLGRSFRSRQPVTTALAARIWPTLQLCLAAMVFAIAIGVPLGFLAALKPGSFVDTVSMIGAVSGLSLPKFWLGLLLMYLFALKLGWLPSFGYGRWRAAPPRAARDRARRRPARAPRPHHAGCRARDHERRLRAHRPLEGHERAPGRALASRPQTRS